MSYNKTVVTAPYNLTHLVDQQKDLPVLTGPVNWKITSDMRDNLIGCPCPGCFPPNTENVPAICATREAAREDERGKAAYYFACFVRSVQGLGPDAAVAFAEAICAVERRYVESLNTLALSLFKVLELYENRNKIIKWIRKYKENHTPEQTNRIVQFIKNERDPLSFLSYCGGGTCQHALILNINRETQNFNLAAGRACQRCGNCDECCVCHRTPEDLGIRIGRIDRQATQPPKFHIPGRKQRLNNPSPRCISAEIEVAGCRKEAAALSDCIANWGGQIVHDGSLPATGFEINTAPAGGDLFLKEIQEICDNLTKAKASTNRQCGCHIHVNGQDFNYFSMRRLIKIYCALEPLFFAMIPRDRRNSQYCQPCAYEFLQKVGKKKFYTATRAEIICSVYENVQSMEVYKRDKQHSSRYRALNLHSYFHRGSVEVRLLEGTVDYDTITKWGMLWAHLLDFAHHQAIVDDNVHDEKIDNLDPTQCYQNMLTILDKRQDLIDFVNHRLQMHWNGDPYEIKNIQQVRTTR